MGCGLCRRGSVGGPLHTRLLEGRLHLRWGAGGSQQHSRTQQRPRRGWGQLVRVTPPGGPCPTGPGPPGSKPSTPRHTWAWVGGKGAALGGGVSARGCGPLSLPRSPLLLPTKVVLTAALERASLPPPTPVTRQPEAQPCSHRSLQVTPCSSFPLGPG